MTQSHIIGSGQEWEPTPRVGKDVNSQVGGEGEE